MAPSYASLAGLRYREATLMGSGKRFAVAALTPEAS